MIYPLNKNGCVINEASSLKVQPEYRSAISDVVDICQKLIGEKLQSVVVRGSVSVGMATPNVSDLDIVAIVKGFVDKKRQCIVSGQAEALEKKYPYITLADITVLSLFTLTNSTKYANLRVCLKTRAICVWGEDIIKQLPDVKPGKDLATTIYGELEHELSDLRKIFTGEKTNREYLCREQPIRFWWPAHVYMTDDGELEIRVSECCSGCKFITKDGDHLKMVERQAKEIGLPLLRRFRIAHSYDVNYKV